MLDTVGLCSPSQPGMCTLPLQQSGAGAGRAGSQASAGCLRHVLYWAQLLPNSSVSSVLPLVQEPDHSVLHSMLNTIEQIVKLLAPDLMSLQQIQQAFDRWKVVLSDSSKRRRERAERQQQEDWDQEEEEAVQVGSPYLLGSGWQSISPRRRESCDHEEAVQRLRLLGP